ncbi:hypothetical protein CDAR_194641 [Caerostris darwini]|uniref:Uncharacterized protein n=1 Tax=Caerostris darwini TaxID=1538125 RepID=A0AAV4X8Y5_9ARAC|nr:hypothetical protein CDAR_194641 [Caerostris darwini]
MLHLQKKQPMKPGDYLLCYLPHIQQAAENPIFPAVIISDEATFSPSVTFGLMRIHMSMRKDISLIFELPLCTIKPIYSTYSFNRESLFPMPRQV